MVVREGGLQVTPVCGGTPGEREGGRREGRKRGREMEEERWRKRRREGWRVKGKGWRGGKGKRGGRKGGQGGRERREGREGGKGGCGRDRGKEGRKDEGGRKSRKKNWLHTKSTTWYTNAQRLLFWMNTVTCSPHNILKVKEVLDKEPTRKVLYLLPLFGQCVCW